MVQSSNLTLSFSSESSIEEELKRESTADVITILVSHNQNHVYISQFIVLNNLLSFDILLSHIYWSFFLISHLFCHFLLLYLRQAIL